MTAVLRAEHLVRVLPGEVPVTLVNDISLEIERGEFVCIMGPSGSGKSSLLYLLGLLDVPTSGRVWLDGEDTSVYSENELANRRLEKLGFVFQFHFLLAEFSVLDNVALPMRRLGKLGEAAIRSRAMDLLGQLRVAEQSAKHPHQLSGGQRQRVAIARALANDPLVVLADEPTGNLDTASSATVREILRDLAHRLGKTVVAVTHDPAFAAAADRRIALVDGKLNADWRPAPVFTSS
ncbi:ABC transporter ATP-binding protein [Methylocaldum szegediense]|uniref:Lipoprotein-releasing system ATP-binding protein LolD 2 n=1 Tax=Methylocaldum szegediense TaxID=73780 RepID=A0ABN8X351_9GAMM|nr:ABC transporter ATP-binding protein [Methylocaldum szegediense]CAI8844229.1 Lipoprotein-releasing system ATP-binding protein LolD 2 [Methylocaldum szegediense]